MADGIKVGDVVVLKSGGPKMTVDQIDKVSYQDFDSAWCTWFEGTKKENSTFPLTSLKKADASMSEQKPDGREKRFWRKKDGTLVPFLPDDETPKRKPDDIERIKIPGTDLDKESPKVIWDQE